MEVVNQSAVFEAVHGSRGVLVKEYNSQWMGWSNALIVGLICFGYRVLLKIRDPKEPPGPMPLPFVGNLLQIGERPYLDMKRMAKHYGSVFSLYLGPRLTVVVNTMATAREALSFSKKALSNRPYVYSARALTLGTKSICYSNYTSKVKLLREIFMAAGEVSKVSQLRDIEVAVVAEMSRLKLYMDEQVNKSVHLDALIWRLAISITSQTMLGVGYDYQDPDLTELIRAQKMEADAFSMQAMIDYYPGIFKYFPSQKMKKLSEADSIKLPIIKRLLTTCKNTFVPGTARTIAEHILQARTDIEDGKIVGVRNFTDADLYCYVSEAFAMGAETLVSSLCWIILYLVRHKDLQTQMYEEIEAHVGRKRPPYLSDRPSLHFTQAVMTEGLRLGLPSKIGIPREASVSTTLAGYKIPQGTQVIFNLWAINTDENYWEHPLEFMPNRYLNKNGEFVGDLASMAFGRGQRACAGENIAKAQIFLLLAQLTYFYKFEQAPGEKMPTVHSTTGHCSHPLPFKVLITQR